MACLHPDQYLNEARTLLICPVCHLKLCNICREDPCMCEALPKHLKEMMTLQHHPHSEYLEPMYYLLYLFMLLSIFIAAWQAGYSPWWFIKNILVSLGVMQP